MSVRRVVAEREALIELLGIFTHDLSNPLQSITVLCELGLDEAEDGSDDQIRVQQCLEAAQRMRLILQSMGGMARNLRGATDLTSIISRVMKVLSRRFDRHNTKVELRLEHPEPTPAPDGLEFALLSTCLGFLHASAEASALHNCLTITTEMLDANECRLWFRSEATDKDGHAELLELPSKYGERVDDIVGDLDATFESKKDDQIHLDFRVVTG